MQQARRDRGPALFGHPIKHTEPVAAKRPARESRRVSFVTLGCAKNEVDSDRMRARVLAAGYALTDEVDGADAVIINTCAFITEATEEAIATILEVSGIPHFGEGRGRIIVAGCMPSRYGEELVGELFEVAAFVGCAEEDGIVGVLDEVLGIEAGPLDARSSGFLRTVRDAWAYVKIADGCSRACSFCTIPLIKGRYRSVSADEIIGEVAGLVEGGVREIVLIAQDTGIWGHDLEPSDATRIGDLADLLGYLAGRFADTWFRIMYLQPQGITDRLLDTMAAHDNICDYLDIPLQHANARVLKEMNRSGSGEEYLELLRRIRSKLPDVALRTTLIAGFPGETRAQAAELERFVEEAAFDYVGVFVYSQEEGTVAGARTDQVALRTRRARMQRLRDCADAIGFRRTAERVGRTEEVLITGRDEDEDTEPFGLLGRTKRQAPEVDGMIHLDKGSAGELVSATMVQAYCYELDGLVLSPDDTG